jgi:hypothetical protein
MYAVVLGQDNRFHAVPPERIEEHVRLLKRRHAVLIAEKLNADAPATARDLAGDEVTQ